MKLFLYFKIFIGCLVLGAFLTGLSALYNRFNTSAPVPDFFSEETQDKFYAYATKITGKQSLYVAKLQQVEVFERKSMAKALWFDLPDIILKAEVPVEYNYYVALGTGWEFVKRDQELLVIIPDLTSSTPAVDLNRLRFDVKKGSLLRNESKPLERFKRELPGLLVDRAIAHRSLVREQARESVMGFIKTWMEQFPDQPTPSAIRVQFRGEPALDSSAVSP